MEARLLDPNQPDVPAAPVAVTQAELDARVNGNLSQRSGMFAHFEPIGVRLRNGHGPSPMLVAEVATST